MGGCWKPASGKAAALLLLAGSLTRLQPSSHGCPSGAPIATFQLSVENTSSEPLLPARSVSQIRPGQHIFYEPLDLPPTLQKSGKIALILVPAGLPGAGHLTVLDPKPAAQPAQWAVPYQTEVLGLVVGPQGLDVEKVSSLLDKDQELMSQLADYAAQSTQVESLIEKLSSSEQEPDKGTALSAALGGLAGSSPSKLDSNASAEAQAMALLRALGAYNPLAPQPAARMQQSAGLAASLAGLFLGNPVGLAVGSAAMLNNLRTLLFPGTDFRSALARPAFSGGMTLCAAQGDVKSRARMAYLWALRVPNDVAPAISVGGSVHLPIGVKWTVPLKWEGSSKFPPLERVREWTLAPQDDSAPIPVAVKPLPQSHSLEVDLSRFSAPPGVYRLAGKWDWDRLEVAGSFRLFAVSRLEKARLTEASQDRLVSGGGQVAIELEGDDFQFVQSVGLRNAARPAAKPVELTFHTLPPQGSAEPPNLEILLNMQEWKAGEYQLLLTQPDGSTREVPIRILPPNPSLQGLPLRVNVGEARQKITLRGSGLDRLERIESEGASIQLEPARNPEMREAELQLHPDVKKGASLALLLYVEGLHRPLREPAAVTVAGPRPRIARVESSLPENLGVALKPGELPAGSVTSFSMRVKNLDSRPALRLECVERAKTLSAQKLHPGESRSSARLEAAGSGTLFVSVDPGAIGQAGCTLAGVVETADGASDPYTLGQVIRLPRIESFTLTEEKLGDTGYAGILKGENLETIEKTGWDAQTGLPVSDLPKPVLGEGQKQMLRIAVPWPAPSPHAPLYIWLQGETQGRQTRAKY